MHVRLHVKSTYCSCWILTKLKFLDRFKKKFTYQILKNTFDESRVVSYGRWDRHDETKTSLY